MMMFTRKVKRTTNDGLAVSRSSIAAQLARQGFVHRCQGVESAGAAFEGIGARLVVDGPSERLDSLAGLVARLAETIATTPGTNPAAAAPSWLDHPADPAGTSTRREEGAALAAMRRPHGPLRTVQMAGRIKPIRRFPPGRRCKVCGIALSSYNSTEFCYEDRRRKA